jgi:hypothetical protein
MNERSMNTKDAAQLATVLLKPIRKPRKHYPETVSRYSKLTPLLRSLVRDRLALRPIADQLARVGLLTPEGCTRWTAYGIRRAISICGLDDDYAEARAQKRGGARRSSTPSVSPSARPDGAP